jgi:glycosyltransferase involved in cell wall biosynthesis
VEGKLVRILQVVGTFAPERCGVAHYAARLSTELVRNDVEVAIACGSASTSTALPLHLVRSFPGSALGLVNLLRSARQWHADWLHLQYAPGTFDCRRTVTLLPVIARLAPGRPRIAVTLHEYGGWPVRLFSPLNEVADRVLGYVEQRGWLDREAGGLVGGSDLVIVTNPDHVDAVRARSAALAKRLTVIPVGPNVPASEVTDTQRAEARNKLGVPDGRFVLLYFGFVHPVKGIETLIRSVARARRAIPGIALWIVGGVHSLAMRAAEADGYERLVRQLIAELDLAEHVELTGYLPDDQVATRFAAADLAVLPFNQGATLKSGSLITCLSFGKPTLTTLGGDLESLVHGENVWLVPPRHPSGLAEAICHLAGDDAARNRLAGGARLVARQFAWSDIARRHLALYQRDGRGTRAGLIADEISGTCPGR